ncbi:uncharacterized protein BROUX77_006736 [Berkeleyomyces rouxiae]|uniref:uncharacterized protein n=1 Tax=Berkeleyomyces rouxiae TaxID=2035830 RepID=UPI003B7E52C8
MMQNFPGAATLPRGFRFHDPDCATMNPSTPEPDTKHEDEEYAAPRAPSPQRQRFRLRKRNLTLLSAPTKQFLASVEAADVPIPSIEEPEPYDMLSSTQTQYPIINSLANLHDNSHSLSVPQTRGRLYTPHTPMPGHAPSLSPRRYPDWSFDSAAERDSSPECESSRPSTAESTLSSSSPMSSASVVSDDITFTEFDAKSPRNILDEAIGFPSAPSAVQYESDTYMDDTNVKSKTRKAPWTKAMNDHLWSTYMTYLQDPKVTPFDTGKNGIPPQGVCMRVSRAAKRSWKGVRASSVCNKGRATTPTAFVQWPHTCAATRQQLRDLCRARSGSSLLRSHPTLLSDTRSGRLSRQYRRTTPAGSVFSARDMQVSLTVSTSESMQPHGPLAQLAMSGTGSAELEGFPPMSTEEPSPILNFFGTAPRRLMDAAPISRVSSASAQSIFGEPISISAPISRQNSSGRKTLQSPARLTRSRSNTQHQRRRSRQISQAPRRIKRPSLGGDLWNEPAKAGTDTGRRRARSTSEYLARDLAVHRPSIEELLKDAPPMPALPAVHRHATKEVGLQAPPMLGSSARLGSPFAGDFNPNFTFPARLSQPDFGINAEEVRRPFATVQEASGRTYDGSRVEKVDLGFKLAYIDHRLREIHQHRNI